MTRDQLFSKLVRMFDVLHDQCRRSPTLRLVLPREVLALMKEIERDHEDTR